MFRLLTSGALLLAVASAASASERYIEVWNPPEARGGVLHVKRSHKQPVHRHLAPRTVKFRARQAPMPMPKVVVKQDGSQDGARMAQPDVTDIPRQITPEGNILRVDSRQAYVGVAR